MTDTTDHKCPRCRGYGWIAQRNPRLGPGLYEVTCPDCHGSGTVDAKREAPND